MDIKTIHIGKELLIRADQKQRQIGEYLLSCNLDYTDRVGIMDGLAGVGLLLSMFYRHTNDERYLDRLNQAVDLMNKKIYMGKTTITSYCSGIAGYAWLIVYLKENDLIEVDLDDYLSDIDRVLSQSVMSMIERKEFDQLHGAVGIGFYFLKRGNMKIVETIIDGLYKNRKNIGGHMTWSYFHNAKNAEIVDFGLAHGIPGILYFLHKCYTKKVLTEKCTEIIRESLSFLFNYFNFSGIPSYFPSLIDFDKIMQHDNQQNSSRLAWCYGDLTLFCVLLQTAQDFPTETDIIKTLENVAKRKSFEETHINDSGFCHGVVGIAQIFHRLYHNTGNTCFEETAKFWLEKTLSVGNATDGFLGYVYTDNKNKQPLEILVGISGVGLVLLSFLNPELINWDESLFLM